MSFFGGYKLCSHFLQNAKNLFWTIVPVFSNIGTLFDQRNPHRIKKAPYETDENGQFYPFPYMGGGVKQSDLIFKH